jgi:6-phosphogluconolactonase/glucosamine-6-phosphate isomerase/deaminase
MQFILCGSWQDGAVVLTERLKKELPQNKVLWLTSGGSNIEASVFIMNQIDTELSQNLSVMPLDERYGPVDHANSNWTQLIKAGFNFKMATVLPILKAGLDFNQTADYYEGLATQAFANNNIVIAQLGIGGDGHIAGILPGSTASQPTNKLVINYEAAPYKRLTLSVKAFESIDVVYGFVFGANKHDALTQLKDQALPVEVQPAQILKELKEVYIYNDQLGDTNG